MGCDIHVALECRNSDGDWELNEHLTYKSEVDEDGYKECYVSWNTSIVGQYTNYDRKVEERNYILFGAITGGLVRYQTKDGFSHHVLGMRSDYSVEVNDWIEDWDSDGHTHGSIQMDKYKEELSKMLLEGKQSSEAYGALLDWFNAMTPYFDDFKTHKPEDCRVIYFFDN